MVGLYDGVETYNEQTLELEAYVSRNERAASAQFLLAYHYLVQGHQEAAATQFAMAAELRPEDQLAAKFAQTLSKPQDSGEVPTTQAATAPTRTVPGQSAAVE